jgi:hypothetical protein
MSAPPLLASLNLKEYRICLNFTLPDGSKKKQLGVCVSNVLGQKLYFTESDRSILTTWIHRPHSVNSAKVNYMFGRNGRGEIHRLTLLDVQRQVVSKRHSSSFHFFSFSFLFIFTDTSFVFHYFFFF